MKNLSLEELKTKLQELSLENQESIKGGDIVMEDDMMM